jgi:hypothetical protein
MDISGSHHTFPRDLVLDDDLGLKVLPIPELTSLRVLPSRQRTRATWLQSGEALTLGSVFEVKISCSYQTVALNVSFGVDVLVDPMSPTEFVRLGFSNTPIATQVINPGLRLFIDHSHCFAQETPPDPNRNATQIAPLAPQALARVTDDSRGVTTVNASVYVDGGLLEMYATDAGVVITALTAPSVDVPPPTRVVKPFVIGGRGACMIEGHKLSLSANTLKTDDDSATHLPLPCHHGGPCRGSNATPPHLQPRLHNTPSCLQTAGPHDIAAAITLPHLDGGVIHHVFQFCIPCDYTDPEQTCFFGKGNDNPNSATGSWASNNVGPNAPARFAPFLTAICLCLVDEPVSDCDLPVPGR